MCLVSAAAVHRDISAISVLDVLNYPMLNADTQGQTDSIVYTLVGAIDTKSCRRQRRCDIELRLRAAMLWQCCP